MFEEPRATRTLDDVARVQVHEEHPSETADK